MGHLLLVYNANDGLFNNVTDSVHKLISPSTYACWLCYYTHGTFGMLRTWRDVLQDLPCEVVFEHRNTFRARTQRSALPLPAVLWEEGETLDILIAADEIAVETEQRADGFNSLIVRIQTLADERCRKAPEQIEA